ncbi:riboflavin synthase subunit alpha [Pontibacter sp. JAM-7]|uniref:riboflavin synthase subunit alpha n=1 Tax=Pontibacter sp. JAM-7 TaxID=3366581 RepID=UPI003AF962C0
MFTGIVQGLAKVLRVTHQENFMQLELDLPEAYSQNLQQGASIAVNGTCLTVTGFNDSSVSFDLIEQTLQTTNLGQLRCGDQVNFERAARIGDEIGGHLLSGHIHAQAEVVAIEKTTNNCTVWFDVPPAWQAYIFDKGFIALDGCSLTVKACQKNRFCVGLIPETLAVTRFGFIHQGDLINLEIDSHTQAVVDSVERYLANRSENNH